MVQSELRMKFFNKLINRRTVSEESIEKYYACLSTLHSKIDPSELAAKEVLRARKLLLEEGDCFQS